MKMKRNKNSSHNNYLGEEAKAKARIWEQRGDEFYSKISQQRFDEVIL
jgi:hypothetical protein